ncbi:MAG: 1-acyl-sn-glycerol-3-phosphate acyltransferase [Alphaproteobacteria bacterium]|nr:1-acyl-sn-glycerol-3-phosphate acyltransferase [Alphaproteobacteria bacterium]
MNRTYQGVVTFARFLIGAFFRRVEVVGLSNVPANGGGLLVSWHPNGMIDPALIFTFFPRQVVFGARHGLFKVPGLGQIMRAVGTVPIFRSMDAKAMDPDARRAANQRSLDALAGQLARTSYSCLFPEGDSHDAPHPTRARSGAARLYYRARQLADGGDVPPVIVPVGLFYDDKQVFRSSALIVFHPPLPLNPELDVTPGDGEDPDAAEARVRALTAEIERVLHDVVHATDDWRLHHLMHRARKLVRAERAHRAGSHLRAPRMEERILGFARIRSGYVARMQTHPEQVEAIKRRLEEYDEDLRALGLEDHELDEAPRLVSPWLVALLLLQVVFVFLLLPPILFIGFLVNAPVAGLLWVIAQVGSKRQKDVATAKLMVGAVLFPLAWIGAGVAVAVGQWQLALAYPSLPDTPVLAGLTTSILAFAGGAAGVRYLRVVRETARAVRVRLTRQRARVALAHLKVERAELHDLLIGMGEGLDLPGEVAEDGRVVADE